MNLPCICIFLWSRPRFKDNPISAAMLSISLEWSIVGDGERICETKLAADSGAGKIHGWTMVHMKAEYTRKAQKQWTLQVVEGSRIMGDKFGLQQKNWIILRDNVFRLSFPIKMVALGTKKHKSSLIINTSFTYIDPATRRNERGESFSSVHRTPP